MDFEVEGIPVNWLDVRVGTARLVEDDYGVRVDIRFDARPGLYLRDAAERGMLTGLTISTEEVRPARRLSDSVPAFYEGRAEYGRGRPRVVLPKTLPFGVEPDEK